MDGAASQLAPAPVMAQLMPIEDAGDFGADAAHTQPQPMPIDQAGNLKADVVHEQPQPTPIDDGGGFDAVAAHKQLLQALRGIDCKLDGLAKVHASLARHRPPEARAGSAVWHDHAQGFCSLQPGQRSATLGSMSSLHPAEEAQHPRWSAAHHAGLERSATRGLADSPVSAHGPAQGVAIQIRPGYDRERLSQAGDSRSTAASRWTAFLHQRGAPGIAKPGASWEWTARSPDSKSGVVLDVLGMVLLLYDAFVTPYSIAWDLVEEPTGLAAVEWITRIFWTLDLLLNLVTGYFDEEARAVLNIRMTVRRYLTSWFLIDLPCVICDWITVFNDGQTWTRWVLLARLVRFARRVPRIRKLTFGAKLVVQTTGLNLVIDIAQLILVIVWVNHLICCVWFGIGQNYESDTGVTWLSGRKAARAGPYYDYLTALHWAMAQMTPGSMEVTPQNSLERLYNLVVLMLGLLMGSSLVATITSRMTQYQLRRDASTRKFIMLRRFLHQQGVDARRAVAIMTQAKNRASENKLIKAKDVECLSLLPKALQDALWHSWCARHLSVHAFLNALNGMDASAMLALCKGAVVGQDVASGDLIFEEGLLGDHMCFVVMGRLEYIPGELAPEVRFPDTDARLTLGAGDWCSEPTLWTIWTYLGSMEAASTTEILSLSAADLASTLTRFPDAAEVLTNYCQAYHMHINEPGVLRSDLSYVIDLSQVVSRMDSGMREQLAVPVIRGLESRFWLNHASIQRLKAEVADGKCDVGLVGSEVVRNTFVVALTIYRHGSGHAGAARFLAKIGEAEGHSGKVVGHCLLPGVKRKARETYSRAVERLLQADMSEIAQHMETHFSEGGRQTVSFQVSRTYGIRTRYLLTIFNATLPASARLTCVSAPASCDHLCRRRRSPRCPSWWLRRESRQVAADQERAAAVLAKQDSVVVLDCDCDKETGANRAFYLWLDDEEFEVLSKDSAKPILETWLESLDHDQEPFMEPARPTAFSNTRSCSL